MWDSSPSTSRLSSIASATTIPSTAAETIPPANPAPSPAGYKLLIPIAFSVSGFAQQTYTLNNETLELKTEVEGNIDLLWNIFDGKYRYFVRDKDGDIQELVNTKNKDTHKYQEE
mgnify:CR=1 FL=1